MISGRMDRLANQAISLLGALAILVAFSCVNLASADEIPRSNVRPPEGQDVQQWGGPNNLPATVLPQRSDPKVWRDIRHGIVGTVSIPDKKSGQLVQSAGTDWKTMRNGTIAVWGGWGLAGIVVLLALFLIVRGRIPIDGGPSGRAIERFNALDRFAHWLTAGSFVVLGLTGLNLLYGRQFVLPVLGPETFSALSVAGKYAHDNLAFAFMAGIVLMLALWLRHNIPDKDDLIWLAKGGGILFKGVHPPARKFNAGQKILFWIVVIGGVSISLSGLALLFPFKLPLFAATFELINIAGFDLPTNLSALEEVQLSQLWHAVVGLVLIIVIIAHIYIGTIGMVGAFDAMGTGKVDANWAREHHSLWAAEAVDDRQASSGADSD
ncbi:MAG: formate dehydrogenase subunit gamma [Proteobacteria bacterium]|nr:formate dehydrogenase subunit gamma [Pseudomonadota bacterium]